MNSIERIRVLLADDHALFREGLVGIISAQPGMEVVGEASDGLEALVKARELAPDLILMDIGMPGCDGLEATRYIKRELPAVVIVILTVHDEEEKLFEAIKNGAQGYLLKNIRSHTMLELVWGAVHGEAAITPILAGHMLEEFRRLSRMAPLDSGEDVVALTSREQEVLGLVAAGASDKKIADALFISRHTVKSHMRNILAKLHVNSRREAARYIRHKGGPGLTDTAH
ncbi:MAG: response regulator transcription factor [Anaerolineae bacterium]|nr:response regulator transcription factor [Anaerolineae bacterium]NUQ04562.1 response regulator transcription factor [Anaerolineae bacterium]